VKRIEGDEQEYNLCDFFFFTDADELVLHYDKTNDALPYRVEGFRDGRQLQLINRETGTTSFIAPEAGLAVEKAMKEGNSWAVELRREDLELGEDSAIPVEYLRLLFPKKKDDGSAE
jgi:hypothetical protein